MRTATVVYHLNIRNSSNRIERLKNLKQDVEAKTLDTAKARLCLDLERNHAVTKVDIVMATWKI